MADSLLTRLIHLLELFYFLEKLLYTGVILVCRGFLFLIEALPEQNNENSKENKDVPKHWEIARQGLNVAQLHYKAGYKWIKGEC